MGGEDYYMAGWDCACGCLAVRLAHSCGLILQPIGCKSDLACDVQRYCSCSCHLWGYISVMPLPFFAFMPTCAVNHKSVTHGQCDARLTVTFLALEHHCPSTSTKLYSACKSERRLSADWFSELPTLMSNAAPANEMTRQIERGARIVCVLPMDTKLILQMPRGNLEAICPRSLVLSAARKHLDKYASFFGLLSLGFLENYAFPNVYCFQIAY